MTATKRHGGRRPNSGRKRIAEDQRRVALPARVTPETLARIQVGAVVHGLSVGEFVDLLAEHALSGFGILPGFRQRHKL